MSMQNYIHVLDEEMTNVDHLLHSIPFNNDGAVDNFLNVYHLQYRSIVKLKDEAAKFPMDGSKLLKFAISLGSLLKTLELDEELYLQQQKQQRTFLNNLQQFKDKQQATSASRTPLGDDPFISSPILQQKLPNPSQHTTETQSNTSTPTIKQQPQQSSPSTPTKAPKSAPSTPVLRQKSTPSTPIMRQKSTSSTTKPRPPSMYIVGSPQLNGPSSPTRRPPSMYVSGSPKITIPSSPMLRQSGSPIAIPPSASPIISAPLGSEVFGSFPNSTSYTSMTTHTRQISRHVISSNSSNQPVHHVKFVRNLLTVLKNFDIGTSQRSSEDPGKRLHSHNLNGSSMSTSNSLDVASPIKLNSKQLSIEKLEINISLDNVFIYKILFKLILRIFNILRANLIIENLAGSQVGKRLNESEETSSIFSSNSNNTTESTVTIPLEEYLKLLKQIINRIVCGVIEPFIRLIFNELVQNNMQREFANFVKEI